MVSQLSEFLLARVQVLLLALSGKPVEFSLFGIVSRYCSLLWVVKQLSLVLLSMCEHWAGISSLLWVVNQLRLVLLGKCEKVLLLALGGKPVKFSFVWQV